MMRRTLLALALLAAPAVVMAQQPSSAMTGQAPADTSSKAKADKKAAKKHATKKHAAKPAAKPEAKDTSKMKP